MQTTQSNKNLAKRFWKSGQWAQAQTWDDSTQDTNQNWKRTKCEIYTRVMWYYRPVSFFNEWKKSEYYSRTYFGECKSLNSQFCEKYE